MDITILGTVESVNSYNKKDGVFGANVMVSALKDKQRGFLTLQCPDQLMCAKLEDLLQEEVVIQADLQENKFGIRLGAISSVAACE